VPTTVAEPSEDRAVDPRAHPHFDPSLSETGLPRAVLSEVKRE
jgi:hypothetical protein